MEVGDQIGSSLGPTHMVNVGFRCTRGIICPTTVTQCSGTALTTVRTLMIERKFVDYLYINVYEGVLIAQQDIYKVARRLSMI